MINAIQVFGLIFGLIMLYLTYLYYRKGDYGKLGFRAWTVIWIVFLICLLFPPKFMVFLKPFQLQRVLDILVIGGFFILFGMMFFVYDITKKNEKKINHLVREEALHSLNKTKK